MTNWIDLQVIGRTIPESEVDDQAYDLGCASEVLGIVLYEIVCLNETQQRPIQRELGVNVDLAVDWLKLFAGERLGDDSAPYWQCPLEAAEKLRRLAGIFESRGLAAQHLWQLSWEGVFSDLMPRAMALCVDTDEPSPGCPSGDWACHLASSLRANAALMDALAQQGESEVLLTFAPFL